MHIKTVETYSACPACSSLRLTNQYSAMGYIIAKCGQCELVFVRDKVTLTQLEHYYVKTTQDYVYRSEENTSNLLYCYERIRAIITRLRPAKGSILDVGCSEGHFLRVMEGWDRHGTEITPEIGRTARKTFGDKIHVGPFETYSMSPSFFDVISLQDVFDHFIDPKESLKHCRELLKPGGLIVIKVHNIGCLFAKLCGRRFYAIMPPGHLFYFSRKSLSVLLRQEGFRILETTYIPHILQIKTVFYRLSRGNEKSFAYHVFKLLQNSTLGNLSFKKNLRDVITIIAVKDEQ